MSAAGQRQAESSGRDVLRVVAEYRAAAREILQGDKTEPDKRTAVAILFQLARGTTLDPFTRQQVEEVLRDETRELILGLRPNPPVNDQVVTRLRSLRRDQIRCERCLRAIPSLGTLDALDRRAQDALRKDIRRHQALEREREAAAVVA